MIATGIIRRIDDLGRINIPKEIRRKLKVNEGDPFEIFMTREGEVILKPYRTEEYTLRKGDFWEELIAPSGKVVCSNHRLSANEILNALGVQYNEEELESDEEEDQSSSFKFQRRASERLARFFIIPHPPPICQAKSAEKIAQNFFPKFVQFVTCNLGENRL